MKKTVVALLLCLLSPYIILISYFPRLELTNFNEFFAVFKFTFQQAVVSAFVSLFFGFFIGLSLSSIENKKYHKYFETLCYLPCFVPTLFVVFSGLNISQWFGFPMQGFWGIVILHAFINIGLVGALYGKIIVGRLPVANRLSLAYGFSVWTYIAKVVLPLTSRDLFLLFSVIFIFCFTSFSIPLMIGGVHSTTIELLIYEKLIVSNEMGQALSISLLQFMFILFFLLISNLFYSEVRKEKKSWVPYFKNESFLVIPLLLSVGLITGLLAKLSLDIGWFSDPSFGPLLMKSFFWALLSGYAMFLLCQFVFSLFPSNILEYFLSSYSSPSTVLIGLALVLVIGSWHYLNGIALLIAYLLLFFPTLFKMFMQSFLVDFKHSVKLAQVMGAGYWLRLKMISFPLAYPICLFLAFLTAVWVMGDYAVSSLFLEGEQTLALYAKDLIRSYRMSEASFVVLAILVCEVFIYFIYRGLMYVSSQKY